MKRRRHTQSLLQPGAVIPGCFAIFADLEPLGLSVIELVTGGRSAGCHVGQHRTGVMGPLKIKLVLRSGKQRVSRTLLRSAPFQLKVRASPGFALATRDATVAFGPHVNAGLLAPLFGSGVLT